MGALAAAAAAAKPARALKFLNPHTGERLKTAYWEKGRYIASELAGINRVLRDWRTGEVAAIDPRLLDVLSVLQTRMGSSGWFRVISGYRSPRTNAALVRKSNGVARKSLHMKGMAIDVSLSDRDLAHLRAAALALGAGGVGYYPKPGFVHLDTGRVRFW